MILPTTIWIIGWLFSYGMLISESEKRFDTDVKKHGLKYAIVAFAMLGIFWPLMIGCRVGKLILKQ